MLNRSFSLNDKCEVSSLSCSQVNPFKSAMVCFLYYFNFYLIDKWKISYADWLQSYGKQDADKSRGIQSLRENAGTWFGQIELSQLGCSVSLPGQWKLDLLLQRQQVVHADEHQSEDAFLIRYAEADLSEDFNYSRHWNQLLWGGLFGD